MVNDFLITLNYYFIGKSIKIRQIIGKTNNKEKKPIIRSAVSEAIFPFSVAEEINFNDNKNPADN